VHHDETWKPVQPDRRITIAIAGLLVSREGNYRITDRRRAERISSSAKPGTPPSHAPLEEKRVPRQ
jgi:hypothetical protein